MQTIIHVPNSVKTYQDFVNTILVPLLNGLSDKDNAQQKEIEDLKNQIGNLEMRNNQLIAHIKKQKK